MQCNGCALVAAKLWSSFRSGSTLLCPGSMALVTVVRSLDLCYPTWLLRMCLFDMWLIQIEIFCWYKGEKISKSQCKKYNVE